MVKSTAVRCLLKNPFIIKLSTESRSIKSLNYYFFSLLVKTNKSMMMERIIFALKWSWSNKNFFNQKILKFSFYFVKLCFFVVFLVVFVVFLVVFVVFFFVFFDVFFDVFLVVFFARWGSTTTRGISHIFVIFLVKPFCEFS